MMSMCEFGQKGNYNYPALCRMSRVEMKVKVATMREKGEKASVTKGKCFLFPELFLRGGIIIEYWGEVIASEHQSFVH